MELGDLKDSLLNMGKEKGKELGDNLLGERQDEGGVLGTAAGYGKDLFDREFGGAEQSDAGGDEQEASGSDETAPVEESSDDSGNDIGEASSDNDPDADDNSDDDNK